MPRSPFAYPRFRPTSRPALWVAALLVALVQASCGELDQPALESAVDSESDRAEVPGIHAHRDGSSCLALPPPPGTVPSAGSLREDLAQDMPQRAQALSTPQVVYVNFGGPVIDDCNCSDATSNRSFLVGYTFNASRVDFLPYRSDTGKRAILQYLRQQFEPWNIRFTTARPTSGPYTMLVVTNTVWNRATGGIAPLDCDNANRSDVAFVFQASNTQAFPNHRALGRAAAHEVAHSLGLSHVVGSSEIMHFAAWGDRFGRSSHDPANGDSKCYEGNVQYARRMLNAVLGPRPSR